MMENKSLIDIDYYYVPEKLYLIDSIENYYTEKGRINNLKFQTINYMNNFEIRLNNNIDNINEDMSYTNPFEIIILSLYKNNVYVYKI